MAGKKLQQQPQESSKKPTRKTELARHARTQSAGGKLDNWIIFKLVLSLSYLKELAVRNYKEQLIAANKKLLEGWAT